MPTTMIDRPISKETCDAITDRLAQEGFKGNDILSALWEVLEQMKQIILIGRENYMHQNWYNLTVIKNIALDFAEKTEPKSEEIDKFFSCKKCNKVGCDCEIEQTEEQ